MRAMRCLFVMFAASVLSAAPSVEPASPLQWQTVSLTFDGPQTSETATPNPFIDYRMSVTFSKDGAALGGNGYCDGITATGDIWWIRIELGADGMVRWTHLGGTGQLDGITASGTTKNLAEFSDGKVIARFEGTYTRK